MVALVASAGTVHTPTASTVPSLTSHLVGQPVAVCVMGNYLQFDLLTGFDLLRRNYTINSRLTIGYLCVVIAIRTPPQTAALLSIKCKQETLFSSEKLLSGNR